MYLITFAVVGSFGAFVDILNYRPNIFFMIYFKNKVEDEKNLP